MIYRKHGFPQESEVVLCTVEKIMFHSVFVKLDEYDSQGMIHISEISPGRIRNIRDFVKEGKKIVCKVLRVNEERNQIDLSLRRVSEIQKREKVNQIKQEQLAENIIEYSAKKLNMPVMDIYQNISSYVFQKYEFIFAYFEELSKDDSMIEKLPLEANVKSMILETVKQRIKSPKVKIDGELKINLFAPDGVEIIKTVLEAAQNAHEDTTIQYMGSGKYKIEIVAEEWKKAEKTFEKLEKDIVPKIEKKNGIVSFARIK